MPKRNYINCTEILMSQADICNSGRETIKMAFQKHWLALKGGDVGHFLLQLHEQTTSKAETADLLKHN